MPIKKHKQQQQKETHTKDQGRWRERPWRQSLHNQLWRVTGARTEGVQKGSVTILLYSQTQSPCIHPFRHLRGFSRLPKWTSGLREARGKDERSPNDTHKQASDSELTEVGHQLPWPGVIRQRPAEVAEGLQVKGEDGGHGAWGICWWAACRSAASWVIDRGTLWTSRWCWAGSRAASCKTVVWLPGDLCPGRHLSSPGGCSLALVLVCMFIWSYNIGNVQVRS